MKKLKLGMLTDNYPNTGGVGGIGTYTRTMAEELARQGHEVHVFTGSTTPVHRMNVINGVSVWECPDWTNRRQMGVIRALEFTMKYGADAMSLVRYTMAIAVRQAIKSGPFDIIESPEFGALADFVSDRTYTKRLAVRLHGPANQYRPPESRETWNAIDEAEKKLTERADVLTVGTAAARDRYAEFYNMNLDRAAVIGYPIPFRPRNPDWPGTDACTGVFFGRLEGRKGVDTLAASLGKIRSRFPKFHMIFNGKDVPWADGRLGSETIRQTADATGGSGAYTINPPLSDADLIQCVQSSSLCVFPSRAEAYGIVLLEGMMWGTPIVASDIGPFKELSGEGRYALLAKTSDPDSFAEQIMAVLEDGGKAARRAADAYEYVQDSTVECVVPRLMKAWMG